jgi:hypothetical protein
MPVNAATQKLKDQLAAVQKLLEQWVSHSNHWEQRVYELVGEKVELEFELKSCKEGLPIEKADKKKQYYRIDEYGYPALVECSDADGCWYVRINDQEYGLVQSGPLYSLPPKKNTETQEGS